MKASRREATTPLRDLTFGSATPLGPVQYFVVCEPAQEAVDRHVIFRVGVACSKGASSSTGRLIPKVVTAATPAARPRGGGGARQSVPPLAFERSGKDSPARTEPAVSATDSLGGTRRATGPGGFATRGGARGPAPSDNSRRFLDISLPASRLRRDVHRPVDMHDAAVLLFLVPSALRNVLDREARYRRRRRQGFRPRRRHARPPPRVRS